MGVATLYGVRNCDTVKKARAWLDAHGVQYRFHDYKAVGIDLARLNRWCEEVGTTFRKLPDEENGELNGSRALALMTAQPALIKRPVLAW